MKSAMPARGYDRGRRERRKRKSYEKDERESDNMLDGESLRVEESARRTLVGVRDSGAISGVLAARPLLHPNNAAKLPSGPGVATMTCTKPSLGTSAHALGSCNPHEPDISPMLLKQPSISKGRPRYGHTKTFTSRSNSA
jgi:hypothetical protein